MFAAKTILSTGLLAVANAHMLMKSPTPFPSQKDAGNGPLLPDGSNFPCKSTGPATYENGVANVYPLGSKQQLATIGQAVHGGGSCQISITYDTAPTKDSVWKVIHSIEGGCPARNQVGNMGEVAAAVNPNTYDFTVPTDIPTGKGTIAWTWLNRIGNREFYMNCGAVELTGESGDKANYESLPDMVVLNIAPSTQATKTDNDVKFKNPGKSVEDNLGKYGFQVQDLALLAGGGSGDSAPASSVDAPASTAATVPGGVFITVPTSAPTVVPSSVPTTAPVETPTIVASSPVAAPTGGAGVGSGSGAGLSGACSPEGTFNCLGGSYQQCASGTWSVVMPLAPGTSCAAGQSADMKIAAAKKRSVRVFRA